MVLEIKQFIKKNVLIENLVRKIALPLFWFVCKKDELIIALRRKGILHQSKYNYLRDLKNTHEGERCFIVATGPSLTYEDLHAIKDEYSFGMNSCVLALEKTDWIPSLYGIQDEYVYLKVKEVLMQEAKIRLKDKILVADTMAKLCPETAIFHQFPHTFMDHKYDHKKTGIVRFSQDCDIIVYDGYSILFSLMQIAVYMGFKEIYLLGCDCTYKGNKKNFIEHGAIDPNFDIAGMRLIYVHSKFKEYADSIGVKVYNCTRGGMLEEYPRKTLEEVLANKCFANNREEILK